MKQVADLFRKKKEAAPEVADTPSEDPLKSPDEEIADIDKLLADMEEKPIAKAPGTDVSIQGAIRTVDDYNKKRKKLLDEM